MTSFRVLQYNMQFGQKWEAERPDEAPIDLEGTVAELRSHAADLIVLQEVERALPEGVQVEPPPNYQRLRSAFPDYHGTFAYPRADPRELPFGIGLAILSRHRIVNVQRVRLPNGEEPRIALSVSVELPGYDTITVVNVHFDWISNDNARYAQARAVAAHVDTLTYPWLLMGDFNDTPRSRTLRLFTDRVRPERKPAGADLTFPSDGPVKEIDYFFASGGSSWEIRDIEVVADSVTSDHRPVVATVRRTGI